jgi:hypothetical protein
VAEELPALTCTVPGEAPGVGGLLPSGGHPLRVAAGVRRFPRGFADLRSTRPLAPVGNGSVRVVRQARNGPGSGATRGVSLRGMDKLIELVSSPLVSGVVIACQDRSSRL